MAKGYIYIMTNPALIDIKKLLMQLMWRKKDSCLYKLWCSC